MHKSQGMKEEAAAECHFFLWHTAVGEDQPRDNLFDNINENIN
ncbi:MAG: hypothetical protein AAFP90_08975 [Planctomycetota bacterium]